MDGSISRKRKGTQLIPVQELACFDPDFCPRWQKEGWVSHLKEAFRKSQHEEVNIPVIQKEGKCICLGANHRVKALQGLQLEDPQRKIQVTVTVYEDLTKEECWRVSNLNNNHSEEKADITFQDQVFQARRLKDLPKMREKLSLVFGQKSIKKLKADSMGTIISVARYPNQLWGLTCDLLKKHEDKCGYAKPVSQSLFRHLQGTPDNIKEQVLKEAIDNGMEKATRTASELKARHKLRDYFVHTTGAASWSEAEEKHPEVAGGIEKFVAPKISRRSTVPDEYVVYIDRCLAKDLPTLDIDIQFKVNGQVSSQFDDILKDYEKQIKEAIQLKLISCKEQDVTKENDQ